MVARPLTRLLRWYPPAWRDRYGEEFLAYMQDSFGSERPPVTARLSAAAGGIRERVRRSGLTGDTVPPPDRIRAGILLVLVSWTAMVIAGSSFAKLSEHFDSALPDGAGAHHLPDLAYTVIQTAAAAGAGIVIAGAALALPAFVRSLRSGGWPPIRGHVLRAAACTLLTGGMAVPLVVWAHHLNSQHRNGGLPAYGALFLTWAGLVAITLLLWTAVAVVAARTITFSRPLLASEAGLAIGAGVATVAVVSATTLWWAAMAVRAPLFLSGDPSSPLAPKLLATVALMALAGAAAITGVVRIVQAWPAVGKG